MENQTLILFANDLVFVVLIYFSGLFDAHQDYAKSSIKKYVSPDLWAVGWFYFYSGENGGIGHKWKWKNGNKREGEAYRFSSTMYVRRGDWFHYAKFWNITLLVNAYYLAMVVFWLVGFSIESAFHLVIFFTYTTYKIINHIGFVAVEGDELNKKKPSKFATWIMDKIQRRAFEKFLKRAEKYNPKLLAEAQKMNGVY